MRKKQNTGFILSDEVRQQALVKFKTGKPLFGKGGADQRQKEKVSY